MSDFLSKFENFIFDILGLILPGFILLLLLISPLLLIDFFAIPVKQFESSQLLGTLYFLSKSIADLSKINFSLLILVVCIVAYLLGHIVKVFSIILYEIFEAIFDKTLNKLVIYIYDKIIALLSFIFLKIFKIELNTTFIYIRIETLLKPLKNTIDKVFKFRSSNYNTDNEKLKSKCIELINKKDEIIFPDQWYSIYKYSTIVNTQENIKSLSGNFLAKYNLYRSLSFIFFLILIYFLIFFSVCQPYLNPHIINLERLIILSLFIFWFTFHYKYKRYWTLCGNEQLVSLYYFLTKKKT